MAISKGNELQNTILYAHKLAEFRNDKECILFVEPEVSKAKLKEALTSTREGTPLARHVCNPVRDRVVERSVLWCAGACGATLPETPTNDTPRLH